MRQCRAQASNSPSSSSEAAYRQLLAAIVGPDRTLQRSSDSTSNLDQPQKRLVSVTKCRFQNRANVVRIGLGTENLGYGGAVNAWLEPLEDVDWGRRRGKHRIGLANKGIIRHIGGTTIGSAVAPEKRSRLSIYLSARNSIL